jgi:hypothetical protein
MQRCYVSVRILAASRVDLHSVGLAGKRILGMKKQSRAAGTAKPSAYRPNPRETSAIRQFFEERAERAPRLRISKEGQVTKVGPDHPDNSTGLIVLMEALGTTDMEFFNGLVRQLVDTSMRDGQIDEELLNFALSVIKGIKPRDQIEAMLAAQMAAVHLSTMTFARRLANVENIPQQDSAERAFNKLTRTFNSQMEALKRYRTSGEQKVTVQHVTVGGGGQAIVGNVTQSPHDPAQEAKIAKPPALVAPAEQPMRILAEDLPHSSPLRKKTGK